MELPVEIIERILLKCDGKTLRTAKCVSSDWKEIVEYLSKKTPIWKWCCNEEIPEKELVDYVDKYDRIDLEKWEKIYSNWSSWQNLQEDIRYVIVSSPAEIPRISCLAVSGHYIAVGSEDGRVRIFTEHWKPFYTSRHKATRVKNINFIDWENKDMCLVIAYPRSLIIECFNDLSNTTFIEDVINHSVYKNYICYEKARGRINIVKIHNNGNTNTLIQIWFSRIYSSLYPNCLNIWNGICTVVINNEVQRFHYNADEETTQMCELIRTAKLKTSLSLTSRITYQILKDDIIIALGRDDSFAKEEYIEFFIIGPNDECSRKLFNTWDTLRSFITCIFVYGNTLLLGVDTGDVYFYNVSCWKRLDIRNYQKKIIVGRHPIISIDVKETLEERKFYVTSNFCIHELRCYDTTGYI
ncbi:uncharacterized protein LOC123309869 [Coccinella septempunctata]|uniref:uncharacterized protein LOC123309869 n=1 Tax=Coccinella septempunctata TaxID=41139 RepID=UPI001D0981FE|nr:uncharacterized protein LOC123309869 [Coccinella septempunctata]XP_044749097.1 uncharacterized protein LOC123309869 [Coccinella septempunctata]XP_044749098.1 uncharacterized protein LOC123309869 [Coccinella septempunctata]